MAIGVERLDVIGRFDAMIGPIKQRRRGHTGGQLLAAAQLAGEDFLVGLDRQRADTTGQQLAPASGLCATTAAGLARRFTDGQWRAVETGLGDVHAAGLAALAAVAPQRAAALAQSVTIDLDTTDVEVYGRRKRGVAFNHQGQRVGRPHVASWAETATALAADLLTGNVWGSRSRPEVVTCGDRRYPTARHDHGRVASPALPDLRPASQLADPAWPHNLVQGHRAARAAP
jgi:hypothetical protein